LEEVHGKGLEFQLSEKRPSGWEGRLSYTVQASRSQLDNDTLTNSPKHLAKINLIAPLWSKKLFASFEGQEVSRRETVKETSLGGFFIANAGCKLPRVFTTCSTNATRTQPGMSFDSIRSRRTDGTSG
jgi:iron complex outermembrane receptor protein